MRYARGLALGVATVLAVLCSEMFGVELPRCLAWGACAGLALDFVITRVLDMCGRRAN